VTELEPRQSAQIPKLEEMVSGVGDGGDFSDAGRGVELTGTGADGELNGAATGGDDTGGLANGASVAGFDGVGANYFFIEPEAGGDDNGDVARAEDLGFEGALAGDCGLDGATTGDEIIEVAPAGVARDLDGAAAKDWASTPASMTPIN
jgi:hypothetical protein